MGGKIKYNFPIFPDLTWPLGELPRVKAAQACWYFYVLAQKNSEQVGDGHTESQFGLLDGELWMDKQYVGIARGIALLYQLESPDEFAKHWDSVKRQAFKMGYPEPKDEYMRLAPRRIIH